jgi:hypothetical protein
MVSSIQIRRSGRTMLKECRIINNGIQNLPNLILKVGMLIPSPENFMVFGEILT